jgi:hypothetical protein
VKYRRTLLTLALFGPMAIALSSCGTDSTYASNDAYPYDYAYPNGDFFFFGDGDRRFHHRFDHHDDHHFDHGGHSGPPDMFIPGGGRRGGR